MRATTPVPRDPAAPAIALRDGRCVAIREVRPDDAAAFEAAFARLSSEARYNRFMGAVRTLPDSVLEKAVNPVGGSELALVAIAAAEGAQAIVGGARYYVEADGETCEFAITVADDWQRVALAARLMQSLVDAARLGGLTRMRGYVLAANAPMLAFAQRLGFEVAGCPGEPSVRIVTARLDEIPNAVAPG